MNFITTSQSSQYYECGYSCDNALFLDLDGSRFFVTDTRYTQEATEAIKNAVVVESAQILQEAARLIKKSSVKSLVLDPKEFSLFQYETLSTGLDLNIVRKPDFMLIKRAIKRPDEIESLQKAARLGAQGFAKIAAALRAGKTEKELQFTAREILQDGGETDLSFEPILAFGENAAKPHALPTTKVLTDGAPVLLDAGVKYKRYCSDRTRMLEFGRSDDFSVAQTFTNKELQRVYDTVQRAKEAAQKMAKPGVKAKDLDLCARDVIEKAGYGKYFTHSLGHGVGLDIHEFPFINARNGDILLENMVFTIEPGIYISGEFGVRIEDTVVMRSSGVEVL